MTRPELEVILGVHTRIEPKKKCWFIRSRDWSNYTSIKGEAAHRLVYRLCIGPLKYGQEICHKCDRRGCINPDHLFQGTHADNMKDARRKGRLVKISIRKKIVLEEHVRHKQLVRLAGEYNGDRYS